MMLRTAVPRLFTLFSLGFALVLCQLGYWKLVRADEFAGHARNRRHQAALRAVERGSMITADDVEVASSEATDHDPRGLRPTLYARRYRGGDRYAHVVGYSSEKYGSSALERGLDRWLSGRFEPRLPRDLWDLLDPPPVRGADVHLTIRHELQELACRQLGERRGAIVAIDVRSGAILALADWPRFDPARIDDDWEKLLGDERNPLLARAYQGQYPPGSVFKVLTAAAALDAGAVTPDTPFVSEGRHRYPHSTVVDRAPLGRLTTTTAISRSSNIAMAEVALRLGPTGFERALRRQGLGTPPALFEPGENYGSLIAGGTFPRGEQLTPQELAACGYGQGALLVTPVQVAGIGQMLGNRGRRLEPYLVEGIDRADGTSVYRHRTATVEQVVASTAAGSVLKMMQQVMEPGGTASHLRVRGLNVAGKTGSAQNPHGQAHSWFLAVAPVESPEVAVAAVVENAGAGGAAAGPAAIAVLRAALGR